MDGIIKKASTGSVNRTLIFYGSRILIVFFAGEKLAKILDKKLARHREENDDEDEVSNQQSHPQRGGKKKRKNEGGSGKTDTCCYDASSSETSTPKSKVKIKSCVTIII